MSEPLDVRLVPAAAAAWGAAALGVRSGTAPGWTALGVLAVALVSAVVVAVPAAARSPRDPRGAGAAGAAAGVLLVAAAAAGVVLASSAAQVAARDAEPAHRAAAEGAVVRAVVTVVEPPRLQRAAWGPGRLRVTTRVEALTWRGVTSRATGWPAELLVRGSPAALAGVDPHGWGERVTLVGRLSPGTGREVAVLAVTRVEDVAPATGVAGLVARIRAGLVRACAGLGPDARGLVPGMAVGDTSGLETDLADAMRVAGLTHLVAVSGQHVAIVLIVALGAAGALRLPRFARAGAAALALGGFVALVGPSPSVLRAAVMGSVAALGVGVGRPARPVPGLCVAVVGLLAHDPWAAGSLGFQLSVASTAAIVLLAGPAQRALCARLGARHPGRWAPGRAGPRLLGLLLVPLAAQSAAAPLLVLVSPTVSAWAVPANVLAAPAVLPLTVLGLGAALLGAWPAVAGALARLAAVPATWIAEVARAVAALPGASTPWRTGVAGAVGLAALVGAAWWAARLTLVPARPRAARRSATRTRAVRGSATRPRAAPGSGARRRPSSARHAEPRARGRSTPGGNRSAA